MPDDRPDVDTLETGLMKFLDALDEEGNTTKPIRAAVHDLAARARDARNMMYEANAKWEAMWLAEQEAKEAAEADLQEADAQAHRYENTIRTLEADRDYFAKGMGLLRNDRDRATEKRNEALDERNRLARRVTELEAALDILRWSEGEECWCCLKFEEAPEEHTKECDRARAALAEDGGGA